MRSWPVVVALLASAPARADPDDLPGPSICELDPTLCAPAHSGISGGLTSKNTKDPLIGATVVATSPALVGEQVVITDEYGLYNLAVPPGLYTLTIYYNNQTFTRANIVVADDKHTTISIAIDDSARAIIDDCCVDYFGPAVPSWSSIPRYDLPLERRFLLVARDRTHRAWIAPLASADPAIAVTTVDHGTRLAGAPGIPTLFLDGVSTSTLRIGIANATGAGGAATVELRQPSNQGAGETRVLEDIDGTDSTTGAEVYGAGPLEKDRLWLALGMAASKAASLPDEDPADQHYLASLMYAKSSRHLVAVTGLYQQLAAVDDAWANLHSRSRFDESRMELEVTATAEKLDYAPTLAALVEQPRDTARVGAGLLVKQRVRGGGVHQLVGVVAGGAGMRGDVEHSDVTLAGGDDWQIKPHIQMTAGARVDARAFGDDHLAIVSPRLSISHDYTHEGRADTFLAYQRIPHLDDGLPGDWLALPTRYHDELAAGTSFVPLADKPLVVGVVARTRFEPGWDRPRMGLEGFSRCETSHTLLLASATTFDNVATLVAQRSLLVRRRHTLYVASSARHSFVVCDGSQRPGQRCGVSNDGAAGLRWRYRPVRDLTLDIALEGFDGTAGGGGRIQLGAGF